MKTKRLPEEYFDIIIGTRQGRILLAEAMVAQIDANRELSTDLHKEKAEQANKSVGDYYVKKRKIRKWVRYLRSRHKSK